MRTLEDIHEEYDFLDGDERYRLLIESAEDFIFTLNEDICLKSVNSYTANFFGSDAEQLIDRPLADLLDEDMARKNTKAAGQVFATGRSVREEIEIRSVDPPIWLNANYMPLKNESGEIHLVLCIARDITERKTTDQMQRSLEAKTMVLRELEQISEMELDQKIKNI